MIAITTSSSIRVKPCNRRRAVVDERMDMEVFQNTRGQQSTNKQRPPEGTDGIHTVKRQLFRFPAHRLSA